MTVEVTLPSGEVRTESTLSRIASLLNPPANKLIKEKENELYAADVFLPEKLVKWCRAAAAAVALVASATIFFISDVPAFTPDSGLPGIDLSLQLTPAQILALKVLAAAVTFVSMYPKLVQFFFNSTIRLKLAGKKESIDRNMYTALCMLAGLGRGGVPVSRAIELVARSGLKGIRDEFAKIHTSVTIHGYDLKAAILKVALTTPSEKLAHFLKGFVSFLERSKDYGEYVDEYLQLDNVNRRIELAAYTEKLKQLSAMYVTLVALLSSLAIIALSMNLSEPSYDYTPLVVYVGIPFLTLGMSVLYYLGSPDKGMQKDRNRVATYVAAALLVTALFAAYVPFREVKVALLASVAATAVAAHIYMRPALKADEKIEHELNTLLMNLYAASRSGESVVEALKSVSGEIAKRLKNVVANSAVVPVGESLTEESARVKHPFLAALLYVLGNVVHSTRHFADILTAIIYEYHRFVEYSKLRRSVTTTMAILVLMALLLTAFCMGVVKVQLIPTLANAAVKAKGQLYFDAEYATRLANDTVIALAATTPFVLASISWDFRRCFKYYAFTALLALGFIYYL